MTFSTYYDSNDTGLGSMGNVAGNLITFLDKVLVNGYNSQTLTSLTSSGTLVTATLTSHGFRDRQMITITGASPAEYNGTWQVITGSASANTFQFNVTNAPASSPATGTITCIVAPLGWTKPYSGTNLAAYKQPAGNGFYLRVDDTGTTSARAVGYETMTDVNTGANPFPTSTQFSGGVYLSKGSSTGRRMILWGNQKSFYAFADWAGDANTGCLWGLIDLSSFKSGDAYGTLILGNNSAGGYEGATLIRFGSIGASSSMFSGLAAHFLARSYSAVVGSVVATKAADLRMGFNSSSLGTSQGAYSIYMGGGYYNLTAIMPVDGKIWAGVVTVSEAAVGSGVPRGTMPGIYCPFSNRLQPGYVIFQGAGDLAGKELMVIYLGSNAMIYAEISNTW